MKKLMVIQEYVPAYRVPLYDALRENVERLGYSLDIVGGEPSGSLKHRGDGQQATIKVPSKEWQLPTGKIVRMQEIRDVVKEADIVITELATLNTTTWRLVASMRKKLILWGHGGAFVQPGSLLRASVESALARRVAHVITYTRTGRQMLLNAGLAPEKVTWVGNSTDTEKLRSLMMQQTINRVEDRFFYVGGLDESKRLPFLLECAEKAAGMSDSFHLTIYGRGKDEDMVRRHCESRSYMTYGGSAGAEELAFEGTRSCGVWMPGRVGLVAIDALALGIPLFTTDFDYHAPELEYLTEGASLYTLPDDPTEFAAKALEGAKASRGPLPDWPYPTADQVAKKIAQVVAKVGSTSQVGSASHA